MIAEGCGTTVSGSLSGCLSGDNWSYQRPIPISMLTPTQTRFGQEVASKRDSSHSGVLKGGPEELGRWTGGGIATRRQV
jgi:hypothetical protein